MTSFWMWSFKSPTSFRTSSAGLADGSAPRLAYSRSARAACSSINLMIWGKLMTLAIPLHGDLPFLDVV